VDGKDIPHLPKTYLEIVEKKVNEFSFIKSKVAQKISPQLMSFVKEYHGCYYSSQTGQSLFSGDSIGWQTLENSDKVRNCFLPEVLYRCLNHLCLNRLQF
jgi:uncharacterized protein YpbB